MELHLSASAIDDLRSILAKSYDPDNDPRKFSQERLDYFLEKHLVSREPGSWIGEYVEDYHLGYKPYRVTEYGRGVIESFDAWQAKLSMAQTITSAAQEAAESAAQEAAHASSICDQMRKDSKTSTHFSTASLAVSILALITTVAGLIISILK